MEANPNPKKAAESVKPVDKSEAQPSAKNTEPEVSILTYKLDFFGCGSIYIVESDVSTFLFGLGAKEKG